MNTNDYETILASLEKALDVLENQPVSSVEQRDLYRRLQDLKLQVARSQTQQENERI